MQPGHFRILSQISHIIVSNGRQRYQRYPRPAWGDTRTTGTVIEFRIWTLDRDAANSTTYMVATSIAVHAGVRSTRSVKREAAMEG